MDNPRQRTEVPAAEYKLFVRKGVPRLYLRNTNEGIYLSPKGVGWFVDGTSYTRNWDEIASVNLVVGHIPKNGPIGTCSISFRDGTVITVLSASKWGHSDDERNAEYGRFLSDFHGAIPQCARSAITFSAGIGRRQLAAMTIIIVIACLFFFVTPVGLAIYFRSFEALLIAFAGAAFVYPLYKSTEANFPDGYNPDQVPPQLYP